MLLFTPSKTIWANVTPPSQIIDDVMAGRVDLAKQSQAIQSATTLYIYKQAKRIITYKTKAERKKELEDMPELVKPYIKQEVERLWKLKN